MVNFEDKFVFLIGGSALDSVSRYDLDLDKFEEVSSLCSTRESASACSFGDNIYVFGGTTDGGSTFLNSI